MVGGQLALAPVSGVPSVISAILGGKKVRKVMSEKFPELLSRGAKSRNRFIYPGAHSSS